MANDILKLFSAKMDYLTEKQGVIAQNITKANIAGAKAMEIESFDSVLKRQLSGSAQDGMRITNAKHLSGTHGSSAYRTQTRNDPAEVKPSGNSISLEEQLTDLGKASGEYATITGLYKKIMGMLKTAVGGRTG